MSFLDKWFLPAAKADIGRRAFLRGMLAAAPAAVAAAAAIDLKYVPELQTAVREELRKLEEMVEGDLGMTGGRILVAAPKTIFDPAARVWRSVANEAGAWADYVVEKTGVKRSVALSATMHLARLVDTDLRAAEATSETKIDLQLPRIVRTWTSRSGEKNCEIGLGVHKDTLFDGSEQLAVRFKGDSLGLVNCNGKKFAMTAEAPKDYLPKPDYVHRGRGDFGIDDIRYSSLGPQAPLPVFSDSGHQIS